MKRRDLLKFLPFASAVVAIAMPAAGELVTGISPSKPKPRNPHPDPLLADDVTNTDAFAKWSAWERANG